jgi:hypothetical protein
MVHVHVHVGPQAVKAAKERMERERERSQRRRDVAKLKVRQAIMRNARGFGGSMSRCSRPSMRRCEILTIGGPLASSAACEGITTMTIGCASQSRSRPLRMSRMARSNGMAVGDSVRLRDAVCQHCRQSDPVEDQ